MPYDKLVGIPLSSLFLCNADLLSMINQLGNSIVN